MTVVNVHKFGGASLRDVDRIAEVAKIIRSQAAGPKLIIVSAMGKTTNAFEALLAEASKNIDGAAAMLSDIREGHYEVAKALLGEESDELINDLNDIFSEVEWQLEDIATNEARYTYDQVVSVGELASSRILASYMRSLDTDCAWLDIRDVIRTDSDYQQARVDWSVTNAAMKEKVLPVLQVHDVVIAQGFIGSTDYNDTTTLGREGSDYSAAIAAYCLDANKLTIWKDVKGILSADPKVFESATFIPSMSYSEAVEMAYFGAKVLHPKTIRPLASKSIPLEVRSFLNPKESGTMIGRMTDTVEYPPVIVVADDQVLLNIKTKDISFVAVEHLKVIFGIFDELGIKVNLMSNSAISFVCCVKCHVTAHDKLLARLGDGFDLDLDDNVSLITIRHYTDALVDEMKQDRVVLFEQELNDTYQMVVR